VIACDPYVDDRRFKELGVERVTLEALASAPTTSPSTRS